MKNSRRLSTAIAAVIFASLAIAVPGAFAQSSTDGYIEQAPSIVDRTGGDPPDDSDELPFTGLDVGFVGLAGASLLLAGVGMRRLTRSPEAL